MSRNAPCHCGSGKRYKHCHGLMTNAEGHGLPGGSAMPGEESGDADALNAQGVQAAQSGFLQQAIQLFEQALALAPASPEVSLNLGTALFQAGRVEESLAGIDTALAANPSNLQAMHLRACALARLNRQLEALAEFDAVIAIAGADPALMTNRGNCLSMLGKFAEALTSFDKALAGDPLNRGALVGRSDVLHKLERHAEALTSADRALAIDPKIAEALNNRGNALLALRRPSDALASYDRALMLKPDYAEAHFNRGNALFALQRPEAALASYDRALMLKPDYAEAHFNRGNALWAEGKLMEALATYDRAISFKSSYAEAHNNRGNVLLELGRLDEAVASFYAAVSINPDYHEAHSNLAIALKDQGRLEEAVASCRAALAIKPDYAIAHYNLGNALKDQGKLVEAAASYGQALALKPDYVEAHHNLGFALLAEGKTHDALLSYRRALSLKPDYIEAHNSLGAALFSEGRHPEALASFKRALELKPDYLDAYSNSLYLHAFSRDISPEQERDLAAGWETIALEKSARVAACERRALFENAPLKRSGGRKLKVGVVSAELGQHAVAEFLEPFLEHLDRSRFHMTLYPTVARTGPRAVKLAALADKVESLAGISDADAADRIRSAEIDVLVDTTAHMTGCRLGIFAHRAAPVQCHYIGYHGTTGLTEMDWFIADEVLLPASCNGHFREKIWRLPRLWVSYKGDTSLPASRWAPDPQGVITLGSFNNLAKVRRESLDLWARVMNRLPESKLLLKDRKAADEAIQERITTHLSHHGISSERIEFISWTSGWGSHMALYDRLDIALDTIPLNSGTTAFDALWMGVPIVGIEGHWMGGRLTSAILRALGKHEWVAHNEDDYAAIVTALARDVELRKTLRAGQRSVMANSSLCNAGELTRALEKSFESMFDRHLANCQAAI